MTRNDTELLIQKYLNGETTAEEERLLALEVSREDAPEDWKIIAGMLGELTIDEALFDQMTAARKQKPRIIRLWPWLAAACVAALLIVFIGPPRDDVSTQPQTKPVAKVKITKPHSDPPKIVEPKVLEPRATIESPYHHRKKRISKSVPNEMAIDVSAPDNGIRELTKVEDSDIVPYEDPRMQFEEQAKALRERGNRVIQRVSMNG